LIFPEGEAERDMPSSESALQTTKLITKRLERDPIIPSGKAEQLKRREL